MNCNQALEAISAALDGELSSQEQLELDQHLSQCSPCWQLAHDFGVISVILSQPEQPPADLLPKVQAAMESKPVVELRPHTSRRRTWQSLAAVFALVLCLGGLYGRMTGGSLPLADNSDGADSRTVDAQFQASEAAPGDQEPAQAQYNSDCVLSTGESYRNVANGAADSVSADEALELLIAHLDSQHTPSPSFSQFPEKGKTLYGEGKTFYGPEYKGLSANGAYYLFLCRSQQGSSLNYAVSLDGQEILSDNPQDLGTTEFQEKISQ